MLTALIQNRNAGSDTLQNKPGSWIDTSNGAPPPPCLIQRRVTERSTVSQRRQCFRDDARPGRRHGGIKYAALIIAVLPCHQ